MNKSEARARVWSALITVARPDSRFHLDFNEYIPDFSGSDEATARLVAMPAYQEAAAVFITPDNCLETLRAQTVRDGKVQIMPTYGIRRGLVELLPGDVPSGLETYAVLLDAIERFGHPISLTTLRERYRDQIGLVVTGASAVSHTGIRFGKGHGFFDLEWAMLYRTGAASLDTPVIAFVHDCQVVDLELVASAFDTICDAIVTPTRLIEVHNPQKPTQGILWERLEEGMLDDIPPLRELERMEQEGRLGDST
jgi:5-formyltetrahydrofolate cyclo-ligase